MSPTKTPSWAKDMEKLGPGVYLHNGALHVSEAEICQYLRIRYTRANISLIEKAAEKIISEKYPNTKIIVKEHARQR
jgi:hypothetical protein